MQKLRLNSTRAKNAIILLWISAGISIVAIIAEFIEYSLFSRIQNQETVSMTDANFSDAIQLIVVGLTLIGFVFGAITFIQWFRRAYYNQEVKFRDMNSTNGWASGAWFVPIVNLFRPFQLMKEMFDNALAFVLKHDQNNENRFKPQIVGLWWAMWIILNIASNIISRIAINTENIDTLMSLDMISMVLELLQIVSAFITIKMIKDYNEMELIILSSGDEDTIHLEQNSDLLDSGI